jgi:septum formation protein
VTSSPEVRRPLLLASASPSRLRILQLAGFAPEVLVSGVAEDGVGGLPPARQVEVLAVRKAAAVAQMLHDGAVPASDPGEAPLVVACDSMLDVDGVTRGKPATTEEALEGWLSLRGRAGVLRTGHCVIDTASGEQRSNATATVVHFGWPTDDELGAYVASGEPLGVAGGFTLEGRCAAFITGIEGDPGTVMGLSVPALRQLLAELGVQVVDLWV